MYYDHDKCICASAGLSTALEYTKAIAISIELGLKYPTTPIQGLKKWGAMSPLTPRLRCLCLIYIEHAHCIHKCIAPKLIMPHMWEILPTLMYESLSGVSRRRWYRKLHVKCIT